jgi:hypothetical protein
MSGYGASFARLPFLPSVIPTGAAALSAVGQWRDRGNLAPFHNNPSSRSRQVYALTLQAPAALAFLLLLTPLVACRFPVLEGAGPTDLLALIHLTY